MRGGAVSGRAGLRDQLERLPELIRNSSQRLEDDARSLLSTAEHLGLQFVVLTGCGDSAIAARAASYAWHQLAGAPAFPLEAMDVARYYGRQHQSWRPRGQLLLAISSSGQVARVVEAAQRLEAVPATLVCAVTADRSSPLAEAADRVLDTSTPMSFAGPGLCSYVLALLALLHLAIRSGEVRGRYTMDEAARLRAALAGTAEAVAESLAGAQRPVSELGRSWARYESMELLGSGPTRASAAFGAAKMLDAVGLSAIDQDVESFMHLQYFERRAEEIPTVLISSPEFAAESRARDVQRYLETLRRPYVLLTSERRTDARSITHAETTELLAPIVHAAVLALLAAELADLHGEEPGRGATGQWSDSKDEATVRHHEADAA
jgi:glutamine---fructose-6-phosphate transaminase (isomerizing)